MHFRYGRASLSRCDHPSPILHALCKSQLTQRIAGEQAGRGSMDVPSVCKMEAADGLGVLEDAHGKRWKLGWEPINETPRFGNAGDKKRPQTAGH